MKVDTARKTLALACAFNRRLLLRAGAAGVSFAPMILAACSKGPGEINLLMWSDEWPDPVLPNFTAKTGITVNKTLFSQNEEQIAKLKAGEVAFDLCQPTRDRAPQFKDL